MEDRGLHGISLVGTIFLGGTLVFALLRLGPSDAAADTGPDFSTAVTIEAALAFKAKEKKRQPQKRRKQPRKPEVEKVSRDENKVVEDKKPEKKDEPFDPSSVFEKARQFQEDDSTTGSDDPNEGRMDGSEWGTEAMAKGHPYVGELKGRLYKNYSVPAFEKAQTVAIGCLKLDKDGKIIERVLHQRSDTAVLNSAVEEALRLATDMEEPVPPQLNYLTKSGICFRFKL